jgi:PAS domain S-box-containing protein
MSKKPSEARARVARPPKPSIGSRSGTEKAFIDVNQRLQSILSMNEVATWTWDVVNDRVIADENLARLFGVPPSSPRPLEAYLKAIHPEDRSSVAAAIAAAVEGPNDRYAIDYRIVREDGTVSWVTARGKVERNELGQAKQFPGVVIDISDRKSSEQKAADLRFRLEQQASLFDITLSSISDFAYIFDKQGRFVYVNQALLNLWGLKLEDAVGKNFFDLKYPDDLAARLQQQIQQVLDSKKGLTDETPYTSPTGVSGYYEYIFRPVFGRDGDVEVVAGSTRDITERKRVEEELRQSQERYRTLAESLENQVMARTVELQQRNKDVLRQAQQLRDLSVSLMETKDREGRRIARELHDSAGQVLSALLMNLWTMMEQLKVSSPELFKLAEETRGYAQELDQSLRTTSYLLHPPMLDEVGLQAALRWYAEGLEQRAGLNIQLNIPADFARPSRDMEMAIFRVVQECLTNIHRHSGSKSAQITLGRDGDKLLLEVRDAGRGIAADKLADLREKGAGVGLRGVQERVRQFAGDFRIDSQEGSGTTVLVTLPLRTAT